MKLVIAHPTNGTVKSFDCDDDHIRKGSLYEHRLGQEIDGAILDPKLAGYRLKLRGGSDKQGFPMVQGVMANARVSLLISRGRVGFNAWRGRSGERRRKSVRGCILANDVAQLNVTVEKEGEQPIEGVTTETMPRRLGPKRASKIRKLFNLSREDNVKDFVVKRKVEKGGKKIRFKAPKVQRLITSAVRARRVKKVKDAKEQVKKAFAARREYLSMVTHDRLKQRQRRAARVHRKAVAEAKSAKGTAAKKAKK